MSLPPELEKRYQLQGTLGEGGFGRVLRCQDLELGRPVALKLMAQRLDSEELRRRFQREAEVTATIVHAHVVTLYDFGVLASGTPYILYQLIGGNDLTAAFPDRAPAPGELVQIAAAIAEALQAAHDKGVIHRDVKPENILLRGPGDPVLADFGIAHIGDAGTQVTTEGLILGTPAYMAPELWAGVAPSAASDQFAWAATFLTLVTGNSVYGNLGATELMASAGRGVTPRIPRRLQEHLGAAGAIFERSLAANPAARFSDMAAAAAALRNAPVSTKSWSPPRPASEKPPSTTMRQRPLQPAATRALRTPLNATGTTRRHHRSSSWVLRLVAIGALASLVAWFTSRPQAAAPTLLPTTPKEAWTPALSTELDEALRALNARLPTTRKRHAMPQDQAVADAYPKMVNLNWDQTWASCLGATIRWIEEVPREQLNHPKTRALLLDKVAPSLEVAARTYQRFIVLMRRSNRSIGIVAELRGRVRPKSYADDWDRQAINERFRQTSRATEAFLCHLDALPLEEAPAVTYLGLNPAIFLDLFWRLPRTTEGEDLNSPCLVATRSRLDRYLAVITDRFLQTDGALGLSPWADGLFDILEFPSDAGLLPFEVRLETLSLIQEHLSEHETKLLPARAVYLWGRLLLEWTRTLFRHPHDSRVKVFAGIEPSLQRFLQLASSDAPMALELALRLRTMPTLDILTEVAELDPVLKKLIDLETRLAPIKTP